MQKLEQLLKLKEDLVAHRERTIRDLHEANGAIILLERLIENAKSEEVKPAVAE